MKFVRSVPILFKEKYDSAVLSLRTLLIITTGLFCAGIISGLFLPVENFTFLSEEISALEQLSQTLQPFKLSTMVFIYLKNVSALVISLLLSPLLCLMPAFSLLLNGWVISFVALPLVQYGAGSLLIAGILPHGIFEIPAFILGEAIALGFGLSALSTLRSKKWGNLKTVFFQSLRFFVIAIILLIPAAFIETFVTPRLIAYLL